MHGTYASVVSRSIRMQNVSKTPWGLRLAPLEWSNDAHPENFDTYADTSLLPGLLEVFLSDVDGPSIAKPAPPCCFVQPKLDNDVVMAKQAAINVYHVINFCR